MKKFLAVLVVSVFALSACGGSTPQSDKSTPSSPETPAANTAAKKSDLVSLLVDKGCATAKYDGNIPDAENDTLNSKYGFSSDTDVDNALKDSVSNRTAIIDEAIPKIEAQCKTDFTKAGVDVKGFLEAVYAEAK